MMARLRVNHVSVAGVSAPAFIAGLIRVIFWRSLQNPLPGFRLRPSLRDEDGGRPRVSPPPVAGVSAPAFIAGGRLSDSQPHADPLPGFRLRPSLRAVDRCEA